VNQFILWLILQVLGNPSPVPPSVLHAYYLLIYGIAPAITGDPITLLMYWTGN
jgi:hypothetical protein